MKTLAEILAEINDDIIVEGQLFPTSDSDPVVAANSGNIRHPTYRGSIGRLGGKQDEDE
jgi:hypothetical protein